jgi:uncharacterized protein HemX
MNNVMQLVKHNTLKLVMAIVIALGFALSGVGHAQDTTTTITTTTKKSTLTDPTSGGDTQQMQKSGSGWGG